MAAILLGGRVLPGVIALGLVFVLSLLLWTAVAASGLELVIPRASGAPALDALAIPRARDSLAIPPGRDSLATPPAPDSLATLPPGVVRGFRQRDPGDGVPCSLETGASVSYDDENLYVLFVADDDPAKVRAHLARREDILGDDRVEVYLDTFQDGHRAYLFACNPLGVQLDGVLVEGQDEDDTFDTLWYSDGKLTPQGYVVRMTIPFRSLRFDNRRAQTWGIALGRIIQRRNEESYWPYITKRVHGFVPQFAAARGLEGISPGQNVQLIPYGISTRSRFLDMESKLPGFRNRDELRGGLDSKLVLHDQFALDVALNPDFSQVESDEPQVTINQRYEVTFPERRPFFIENASFFQTPTELFFSRRIADPQFGMRLTGKAGRWTVGGLAMDDRAPGLKVPLGDRLRGDRAVDAVVGIQRDIGKQSSLGLLATSRDFGPSFNRVFSLHTRLQLDPTWSLTAQAMHSFTQPSSGPRRNGRGYYAELIRDGRHFSYDAYVNDLRPDFSASLGHVKRVDITKFKQSAEYYWRPDHSGLVKFGPKLTMTRTNDHTGRIQDWSVEGDFELKFTGETKLQVGRIEAFERYEGFGFTQYTTLIEFSTELLKWLALDAAANFGTGINYDPAKKLAPFLGNAQEAEATLTLRPSPQLRFDQTFIYNRLITRPGSGPPIDSTSSRIFENPLVRWKLNYQVSRALSLRAIVDYEAVWPNVSFVKLDREQQVTGDALATYLLNPGTALYVGYTNRQENLALETGPPSILRRTDYPGLATGRQFFFKISYLIRR